MQTPFSICCVYHRSLSSREEAYVGRSEIYSASQKKTDPWNKGMLWPSSGVYDCSHTFIVKYDHYAFEWYIVEILPDMHHWAVLFSKLNVKIHLFHFKVGR